jgi:hypothetical protein
MSNVRGLTTAHLPAILRYLLPPPWREAPVVRVTWQQQGQQGPTEGPTLDWFKALWRYLAGRMNEDLRPLEELLPLLPCNEGAVCRLSTRLPVMLHGDVLQPHLLAAMRKVGGWVLAAIDPLLRFSFGHTSMRGESGFEVQAPQ